MQFAAQKLDDLKFMSCMFCNGNVPLTMRLVHGRYCSALHKEAYFDAMDRLGSARLSEGRAFIREAHDLGPEIGGCLDANSGTRAMPSLPMSS
jgi:hypothetical protein